MRTAVAFGVTCYRVAEALKEECHVCRPFNNIETFNRLIRNKIQTVKLRNGNRITPNQARRAEGYRELRTAMRVNTLPLCGLCCFPTTYMISDPHPASTRDPNQLVSTPNPKAIYSCSIFKIGTFLKEGEELNFSAPALFHACIPANMLPASLIPVEHSIYGTMEYTHAIHTSPFFHSSLMALWRGCGIPFQHAWPPV